jgi:hypothetical protein
MEMYTSYYESRIRFLNEKGKERLSLGTDGIGSDVILLNDNSEANAALLVDNDGKSFLRLDHSAFTPDGLNVADAQGFEARLGVADLVTPRTGETHKTSAASVVLFDKDKNVIWKAP